MHPYPGTLIKVEGPEGGGKSTFVRWAAAQLRTQGYQVINSFEPGGGHMRLREALMELNKSQHFCRSADLVYRELVYIFADRTLHYEKLVRPALEEGMVVLLDRGVDSTLAYQGYGRCDGDPGMLRYIREANEAATGGIADDLTLLFVVRPETGMNRKKQQGQMNRFEEEGIKLARAVSIGFLTEHELHPGHFTLIDANPEEEVVRQEAIAIILAHLDRWQGQDLRACS